MFLLRMTKSEISDEINKREVMTPALYKKTHNLGHTRIKKDNKWDYEIIDRILRDENYTGTLVQGKTSIFSILFGYYVVSNIVNLIMWILVLICCIKGW